MGLRQKPSGQEGGGGALTAVLCLLEWLPPKLKEQRQTPFAQLQITTHVMFPHHYIQTSYLINTTLMVIWVTLHSVNQGTGEDNDC